MGSLRKINGEFYIEFEARGLKYQQKAGRDEAAARKLLAEVEDKIRRGTTEFIVREVDLDIFLKDFRAYIRERYPPRTVRRFADTIKHFQSYLKHNEKSVVKLAQVTPRVIDGYKMHLKVCRTASGQRIKVYVVNLTLFLLRDILEYAITCGYMHDNPTLHVRLLPILNARVVAVVPPQEWKAVKDQCSVGMKPVIDLLRLTGLRLSELRDLTWRQVDLEQNRIGVDHYSVQRYPGRNREIPLVAEAGNILRSMKELMTGSLNESFGKLLLLRPSSLKDFNSELAACSQKAGVNPPVSLQMIRDTFAHDILQKGVSFLKMSRLMGFSDVVQAMRYACFVKAGRYES